MTHLAIFCSYINHPPTHHPPWWRACVTDTVVKKVLKIIVISIVSMVWIEVKSTLRLAVFTANTSNL